MQGPAIEGARGKEPVQQAGAGTAATPVSTAGAERIIGTKRLYADGKFNTKDGKAIFMETKWRGFQAAGKEEESKKFPFLINNGRTNHVWQSAYLDQQNEFVMDRFPFPFIEMNPQDMAALNLKQGDLVEVYNDNGSTQAMAYPTPRAKPKQTFMLFAYPTGRAGQRRVCRGQRVHHPELQANLGEHPQARRCSGSGADPLVQGKGVHAACLRRPPDPGPDDRRPGYSIFQERAP